MSTMEMLLVSGTRGIDGALNAYEGVRLVTGPSITFAQRLVMSDAPPQAIYVEDTMGTVEEVWGVVRACQAKRIPVLVGLFGAGLARETDFRDAGIALVPVNTRSSDQIAAWIAQELGLKARASVNGQTMVAIAGAKGGIGKTLVVALLAEALSRRGLRVLVVDGDLSNSGLVPSFRIPSGFPSYLQAISDGQGAWSVDNIRKYLYRHKRTNIAFLLGSEDTANFSEDLTWQDWQQLMQAVAQLDEFDVVLVDTGPEIKRRPYALQVAANGGYVIFPVPPGRKERTGAFQALTFIKTHSGGEVNLLEQCLMLFMEAEHGLPVTADSIMPNFTQLFPAAHVLGKLPRSPRQVGIADEEGDVYISPIDVAPWSSFSMAVYDIVEAICQRADIRTPLPKPTPTLWQKLWGGRRHRHAAELVQRPAMVND